VAKGGHIADELRRAGIIPHTFPYELALKLGYRSGLAWLSDDLSPFNDLSDLDRYLARVDLTRSDFLMGIMLPQQWLSRLKEILRSEGEKVPSWFELGHVCFAVTWTFGAEGAKFARMAGRSPVQDEVRAMLRENSVVRQAAARFNEVYMECGYSPDETEKFLLEKLVPFLYDVGHQKWVNSPHIPVMQDLQFAAREKDKVLRDFAHERTYGALKMGLESIPFVGKAVARLLFG
jgi:hypothetical protein